MLCVISAVLAACIAITAIVSLSKKGSSKDDFLTSEQSDPTNDAPASDGNSGNTNVDLSTLIIGKWTDSANMSGYEFFEDGSVVVTYVNLTVPVVNMPINGSTKGTYTLNGSDLTVKFSIYSKTISKDFTASVENNTLTLVSKEDGGVATYAKTDAQSESDNASDSEAIGSNGITGAWENGDGAIKYVFDENSKVTVIYKNAVDSSVASEKLNGTYTGVYMLDGENITIQFTYKSKKVTQKYTLLVSGSTMSFTDSKDDTTIFVRSTSIATDANALLGSWSDSTGMSGYEFKENGVANITYVNFVVPVINMPIDGTVVGSYTVEDNKVTISASIYSRTIKNTYTFAVEGNTLTFTDTEDGRVSTYMKK